MFIITKEEEYINVDHILKLKENKTYEMYNEENEIISVTSIRVYTNLKESFNTEILTEELDKVKLKLQKLK